MKNSLKKHFNKITRLQLLVIFIILGNLAMLIIYWDSMPWNNWSAQKIYKKYNSAVCLVHVKWGYKVYLDGEDYTDSILRLFGVDANLISSYTEDFDTGEYLMTANGSKESIATAFFIRDDGILATNLHVIKPWLPGYNSESESYRLEQQLRNYIANVFGGEDTAYLYLANNIKVRGVVDSIWIVPNFTVDNAENRIPCKVIADSMYMSEDDYYTNSWQDLKTFQVFFDLDVALIQTESETLPPFVRRVVGNIEKDAQEVYWWGEKEMNNLRGEYPIIGESVFSMGYPYGPQSAISLISDSIISCQIYNGIVTQYRGTFDFGHNIVSAPGSSGSPLIDRRGRLVGIHSSAAIDKQGMCHATSSSLVWIYLRRWDQEKREHRLQQD
jgi:hypothetical protein